MANNFEGWNSKSHATGSAFPAPTPGKLRVYNMRHCPFAHRTVLALAAKGVPVEFVNVNLKQKPEWLLERNPGGKVPTLELDGKVVYESMICNEWLEESYPGVGRALLPSDPTARAAQRILVERLGRLVMAVFGVYRGGEEKETALLEALDFAEELLGEGAFFGGAAVGWADYGIWPWFERMEAVAIATEGRVQLNEKRHPKLVAYVKRMMADPVVKQCYRDGQEHIDFIKGHVSGTPNYDIGINAA